MNTRLQAFQDFLTTQSLQIPVWGFLINLALSALLGYLLGRVYVRYGGSVANRSVFARNFILLAMTTTLIITVIKTSLALSLGLVGALSIIRFRAAIKDPAELTYLFLCIAVGLGFGADQRLITVSAFILIVGFIWLRHQKEDMDNVQNLFLNVSVPGKSKVKLDQIVQTLKENCQTAFLKRFDDQADLLEATFLIEISGYPQLQACQERLKALDTAMEIRFIDNRQLVQ